ncbi:MAG: hypothetical protein SFY92_10775 [Verrucomicrobiae bacterium]|nr:hypothetical protein [Verrucomicrobiae bacterium]
MATPSEITPVVAAPVVEPPSVVSPQMTAPETASAPVAEHQFVVAPVPTNVAPQVETPLMLTPVTVSDPVVAAPAKPSGSKPSKAVTKAPSKPAAATAKVGMISPTLSLLSEGPRYPWRKRIATTVFWVGEPPIYSVSDATNVKSAWDANWMKNFGGYDDPDPRNRKGYFPKRFQPKQNPFYVALPFNDMKNGRHKTISKKMIPWFHDEFIAQNVSVCKGRWIAIRRGGRTCYAQWEDVGPFEHDHPDYVFGTSRPRSNQNKSAGLDVSPAVRDFLRMDSGFAYTDWRFVDDDEVPKGPWLEIVNSRMSEVALFIEQSKIAAANRQQEN